MEEEVDEPTALLHAFMFLFLTMESGNNLGSIVVGLLLINKVKVLVC